MKSIAMRLLVTLFTPSLLLPFLGLSACRPTQARPPAEHHEPQSYDLSALPVTQFGADTAVQQRILYMPFGEAAARLGSAHFEARSHMVFSRGPDEYQQEDHFRATQDASGNFHVVLQTPQSHAEVYLLGPDLLVRYDKGRLRRNPRRDVDAESWTEIAYASLRQSLELFRPHLRFADPRNEPIEGRQAIRYALELGRKAATTALGTGDTDTAGTVDNADNADNGHDALPLPETRLPIAPPAKWRELARPLDLKGHLWLDAQTGVPLRVQLTGRIEIADRPIRPTELTLEYTAAITKIGKAGPIRVDASEVVDEERVLSSDRDPLGFFRAYLAPDADTTETADNPKTSDNSETAEKTDRTEKTTPHGN